MFPQKNEGIWKISARRDHRDNYNELTDGKFDYCTSKIWKNLAAEDSLNSERKKTVFTVVVIATEMLATTYILYAREWNSKNGHLLFLLFSLWVHSSRGFLENLFTVCLLNTTKCEEIKVCNNTGIFIHTVMQFLIEINNWN